MGARGPAPEPTALKVLKGNPGKRPLNMREPKPPAGEPPMPAWLDDVAKKEWKRCVALLVPIGLLSEADGPALASYCLAYSTLQHTHEIIEREGYTDVDRWGNEKIRPEVAVMTKMMLTIRSFCQEFGMTPSARSRMTMPGKTEDQDPMESLLSGS